MKELGVKAKYALELQEQMKLQNQQRDEQEGMTENESKINRQIKKMLEKKKSSQEGAGSNYNPLFGGLKKRDGNISYDKYTIGVNDGRLLDAGTPKDERLHMSIDQSYPSEPDKPMKRDLQQSTFDHDTRQDEVMMEEPPAPVRP